MNKLILTKPQARSIILHAAGLSRPAQFGRGIEAVYKLIEHLGFIQIDTNYVVERAHHHMIMARVPDYKTEWLGLLQTDSRIIESWTYAAAFIPMDRYRFSLPVQAEFLALRKPLTQAEINLMRNVLDRISREGPLMARDFENDRVRKSSGWWDWRPSKVALERLNFDGRLVTVRRNDFQKMYDLPENVVPGYIDKTMPGSDEYARHVIIRSLRSLGLAYFKEIAWTTRHTPKESIKKELERMVQAGEVCEVEVAGLKSAQLYMLPGYRKRKIKLSGDAFILSPFDILNVFRHRLRDFFDFDYQVECFVPAPKRKYGYFSLPILIGDTFVARMDSKADRKKRILIVNNIHFESMKLTKAMLEKLVDRIEAFAKFNQCDSIVVKKSNNKTIKSFFTT